MCMDKRFQIISPGNIDMSKTRQRENIWNKSRNLIAYYKSRRENGPHLPVDVSVQQASWKWIYHVQIDSTSDILFTMSDRTSGKSCVEEWLFQPSINCNELMLEIVVIVLEIYILNIIRNSSATVNLYELIFSKSIVTDIRLFIYVTWREIDIFCGRIHFTINNENGNTRHAFAFAVK